MTIKNTVQSGVASVGGKRLNIGGAGVNTGLWRNARIQAGQGDNWDTLGIRDDPEGVYTKVFAPHNVRRALYGAEYYSDGDVTATTAGDGNGPDGRSLLYMDIGQSDVTVEVEAIISDLSALPLAVPDEAELFVHNPPRKISDGGVWYTGNRTVGCHAGPAVCIVDEDDYRTANYGLVPILVPELLGTSGGTTTKGGFYILALGDGSSANEGLLSENYAMANSDMPDAGDVLTIRAVVSGNKLNVYVDGLKVSGDKTDNVHVIADAIIPEAIVDATKHGVFARLRTGQELPANSRRVAKAPAVITYDDVPHISKITVDGEDFVHNGKPWKAVGTQGTGPGIDAYGNSYGLHEYQVHLIQGSLKERLAISKFMGGIGVNGWGFNMYRLYLHLWAMVEGDSILTLSRNEQAFTNLVHWVTACRDNGMHVMLCANCIWIPNSAPAWFDALDYADRWTVHEFLLSEVAQAVDAAGLNDVILGYELVSEPNVEEDAGADWYQGLFEGYYYVPTIARGIGAGTGGAVAQSWVTQMSAAVKNVVADALVTVGSLVVRDEVTGVPSTGGPFAVNNLDGLLDFHAPHIKPVSEWPLSATMQGINNWKAAATSPVLLGENWSLLEEADVIDWFEQAGPALNGITCFFQHWNGYGNLFATSAPSWVTPGAELTWAFQEQHPRIMREYRDHVFFSTT